MAEIELPNCFRFLFEPSRYKVIYGGRGGGKSHCVALALLIQGMQSKHRILCARELQGSLADSVHKLLSDKIAEHGLENFYEVQKATIIGKNGTEFIFAGLRHNVSSIKSFEGCTRVWVEEAHNVSKNSWDVLIPTIRAPNSEIWVTFNPELAEDETYKRFVASSPPNAIVKKINWVDNPWFPDVLKIEMEHLKTKDEEAWRNVWEGECRASVSGAVYGKEIAEAMRENRICKVKYDKIKPVHTFWDLGWSDYVAIWYYQRIGLEHRYIDYGEYRLTTLTEIAKEMQSKPYIYGAWMLPHDGASKTLAADGRSMQMQLQSIVGRNIRVGITPNIGFEAGKNLARLQLDTSWFDADNCEKGLYALRHYRYKDNLETGMSSRMPLHDDSSHGADAFRYSAVAWKQADQSSEIRPSYSRDTVSDWRDF